MDSFALIISHSFFLVLGAGIAGWSLYALRADSARAAIAKEQAARRLKLIEDVALQAGQLHHVFQKYWALILDASRQKFSLNAERQRELDTATQELIDVFEQLASLEARLLLIDEQGLCKLLRTYAGKMAVLKKACTGRTPTISEEQLDTLKKEINALRDKFFQSLSSRYDKKLY